MRTTTTDVSASFRATTDEPRRGPDLLALVLDLPRVVEDVPRNPPDGVGHWPGRLGVHSKPRDDEVTLIGPRRAWGNPDPDLGRVRPFRFYDVRANAVTVAATATWSFAQRR